MGERGTGVAAANWGHVFTNWISGKSDQASAVESAAKALIAALGPQAASGRLVCLDGVYVPDDATLTMFEETLPAPPRSLVPFMAPTWLAQTVPTPGGMATSAAPRGDGEPKCRHDQVFPRGLFA